MNYLVIGAIILVLGVIGNHMLRTGRIALGFGLIVLEVEATKARDRQRAKDKAAEQAKADQ